MITKLVLSVKQIDNKAIITYRIKERKRKEESKLAQYRKEFSRLYGK